MVFFNPFQNFKLVILLDPIHPLAKPTRQNPFGEMVRQLWGKWKNKITSRDSSNDRFQRFQTYQFLGSKNKPLRDLPFNLFLKKSQKFRNYKIIYKRYAGLYFALCVDLNDNELTCLEV